MQNRYIENNISDWKF